MATQNPIEQEGTFPLPEAQLDRFLMHVRIGYPAGRCRNRDPAAGARTGPRCAAAGRDAGVAHCRRPTCSPRAAPCSTCTWRRRWSATWSSWCWRRAMPARYDAALGAAHRLGRQPARVDRAGALRARARVAGRARLRHARRRARGRARRAAPPRAAQLRGHRRGLGRRAAGGRTAAAGAAAVSADRERQAAWPRLHAQASSRPSSRQRAMAWCPALPSWWRCARWRRAGAPPRRGQHGVQGHALSNLRGRGMEYAESREYAAGDDARHIDWRLTARSGKPHTKLFQAERERLTLVVADTAPALYFGTRVRFKSVQAARAGALAAWLAARDGDRIAALRGSFAGSAGGARLRPRAARCACWMRWCAGTRAPPEDDAGLAKALEHARRLLRPGSRLIVLADPASVLAVPAPLGLALASITMPWCCCSPIRWSGVRRSRACRFRWAANGSSWRLDAAAVRQRWQQAFDAPMQAALALLQRQRHPRAAAVQRRSQRCLAGAAGSARRGGQGEAAARADAAAEGRASGHRAGLVAAGAGLVAAARRRAAARALAGALVAAPAASSRANVARCSMQALARAASPPAQVAAMSELLRRAARRIDPQADRLQGEAWLALPRYRAEAAGVPAWAGRAAARWRIPARRRSGRGGSAARGRAPALPAVDATRMSCAARTGWRSMASPGRGCCWRWRCRGCCMLLPPLRAGDGDGRAARAVARACVQVAEAAVAGRTRAAFPWLRVAGLVPAVRGRRASAAARAADGAAAGGARADAGGGPVGQHGRGGHGAGRSHRRSPHRREGGAGRLPRPPRRRPRRPDRVRRPRLRADAADAGPRERAPAARRHRGRPGRPRHRARRCDRAGHQAPAAARCQCAGARSRADPADRRRQHRRPAGAGPGRADRPRRRRAHPRHRVRRRRRRGVRVRFPAAAGRRR